MAPSKRSSAGQVLQAEAVLLPSLRNCLVNLPSTLVSVLLNSDTVTQNVIVELTHRRLATSDAGIRNNGAFDTSSAFFGWTGMQSKPGSLRMTAKSRSEKQMPTVEIDSTFGSLLGLSDGQKVGVLLHIDPPQVHTINIQPLTPADWEIIELHAQFLEINFLSQVRALPSPAYFQTQKEGESKSHPLTLHLSPTSTANIRVSSLAPAPPSDIPFARISPEAEVIVAPMVRSTMKSGMHGHSRSVTSTSRRSTSGRSSGSTVHRTSSRDVSTSNRPTFLRGVSRAIAKNWFDLDDAGATRGLYIWVDNDFFRTKPLKGVTWVSISVVHPVGIQEPVDVPKDSQEENPASKIVARIFSWSMAPSTQHAALSDDLCEALECVDVVGAIVRVEAAPAPLSISSSSRSAILDDNNLKPSKELAVRGLKIYPFSSELSSGTESIKFGHSAKKERNDAAAKLREIVEADESFLNGPITDGMIIPSQIFASTPWSGGIVRFHPTTENTNSAICRWISPSNVRHTIDIGEIITRPDASSGTSALDKSIPRERATLVGIDSTVQTLYSHLSNSCSVLLTGALGAGKTSVTYLLGRQLQQNLLFKVIYFPCRNLIAEEARTSSIRDTLHRLFALGEWSARLGGESLIILDDLDVLCPVETELQIGGENGRSRQISEIISSLALEYCYLNSGVILLATAQSKESLNQVIISGHTVREIIGLKAPNKQGRRQILEAILQIRSPAESTFKQSMESSQDSDEEQPWFDATEEEPRHSDDSSEGFVLDQSVDLLDISGQTDGYMPKDLELIVSRTRGESLARFISSEQQPNARGSVLITREDFSKALEGFRPASLRNVPLQSSTTKWSSIGGLHKTRRVLLETLQYPTTYAPIFAQCPLRLRSGLLLYGYPGCGKTLLASAVAGECGLNFISVKGPEILNKYIGASEKAVRDLFERAEAAKPCILFFDEFDSIAPKRGHDSTGVTDRVVNQLLTQMDGAEGLSGVYVLAATSRPDLIDPALLRPGRLDKNLLCDMPDLEDRLDILKAVSDKVRLSEAIQATTRTKSLAEIATRTQHYSGADLQALVYNAQLEAIHDALDGTDNSKGFGARNSSQNDGSNASVTTIPDFTYFRLDDTTSNGTSKEAPTATQAAERAAISQKLQEHLSSRQRLQETRRHPQGSKDSPDAARTRQSKGTKEPIIQWKHIEAALATTRPSIAEQERRRLAAIYHEFAVGRNGELPSGQGGSEIGGRTSLM